MNTVQKASQDKGTFVDPPHEKNKTKIKKKEHIPKMHIPCKRIRSPTVRRSRSGKSRSASECDWGGDPETALASGSEYGHDGTTEPLHSAPMSQAHTRRVTRRVHQDAVYMRGMSMQPLEESEVLQKMLDAM